MPDSVRLPTTRPRDAGAPPIFERIAILGLGLIGGSIALAAREIWPTGRVIAVDRRDVIEQAIATSAIEQAIATSAIDVLADEPSVISEADLVILAAPVRQNLELLAELGNYIAGEAVVTDVGSTKRAIAEAARTLPERLTFIGGHPLGGAARGGFEYARADLFTGRPWIFTPHGDDGGDALEKLFAFVAAMGATPRTMRAAEHDHLLAFLSHLPQMTVSALMDVVGAEAGEEFALAGRGLVDTTRLASSPPGIWQDIAATNADRIRPALDALIARLTDLRDGLDDPGVIERVFADAARSRERLLQGREGST